MMSMKGWAKAGSVAGVSCFVGNDGFPKGRGDGILSFPPRAVFAIVTRIARRGEFDQQFDRGGSVERLDARNEVVYLRFRPVSNARPRDVCAVLSWAIMPDSSLQVVLTAIAHPLCPPTEGVVRWTVFTEGWNVQPYGPEGQQSRVTYVVKYDTVGAVSPAAMPTVLGGVGYLVSTLGQALARHYPSGAPKMEPLSAATLGDGVQAEGNAASESESEPSQSDDDFDEEPVLGGGAAGVAGGGLEDAPPEAEPVAAEDPGYGVPPPLTHPWAETCKRAQETFRRYLVDMSQWNLNGEGEGVRWYTGVGKLASARGEGTIPFPPKLVLDVIMNMNEWKEYDETFEVGRTLEIVNAQTRINYSKHSTPTRLIAQRSFVSLVYWVVDPDGTIILGAEGVSHPDAPVESGVVRGDAKMGGWSITPIADGKACKVVYMMVTDVCGSLPAAIVKRATTVQGKLVLTIRKYLERKYRGGLPPYTRVENTVKVARTGPGAQPPAPRRSLRPPRSSSSGSVSKGPVTASRAPSGGAPPGAGDALEGGASAGVVGTPAGLPSTLGAPSAVAASPLDYPVRLVDPPKGVTLPLGLGFVVLVVGAFVGSAYIPGVDVLGRAALVAAAFILAVRLLLDSVVGSSKMSTRQKLMIATWDPPGEGNILGAVSVDCTKALAYVAEKRRETSVKVTITHVAIKAVAEALARCPTINGHIVMGRYVPSSTVDIGCLVAMEREEGAAGSKANDLANVTIRSAHLKSVVEIAQELAAGATRLRAGQDKDFEKSKPLMRLLPTWVLSRVVKLTGFIGCELGLSVAPLGVKPRPFGTCLLTAFGSMGLDMAWAPHTPFSRVPLTVGVGAVSDKVIAVDGRAEVRPVLSLFATIDHRFMDGADGAKLAAVVRAVLSDPKSLEGR